MRVVRDRADVRWLPSRFRFAAFRLLAWFRMRRMPPRVQPGLVLTLDHDQSGIDHYLYSALIGVVTVSYVSAALMLAVPVWIAVPVAALITGFLAQIPMYVIGVSLTLVGRLFGRPGENHLRIQNFTLSALLVVSACWAAVSHSWLRFVCRGFLVAVAVNALAALAAIPLKSQMAEMEQRFEVEQ